MRRLYYYYYYCYCYYSYSYSCEAKLMPKKKDAQVSEQCGSTRSTKLKLKLKLKPKCLSCKGTELCVAPCQSCLDSNTMIGANGEHVPVGHPLMTTITGTWCRHILFTQIDFPSGAKCLSTVRFASVPFSLPVLVFFRFPSVSLSLVMQMQNLFFMH